MDDTHEQQRKRVLFRSQRRGTKESDLVIGGFARTHLAALNGEQLDRFEALLGREDPDILGWIIGLQQPPSEFDTDVLTMIKNFKNAM